VPAAAQTGPPQFRISDHYRPWPKQPGRETAPQEDFHKSGARYRLEVGGYGSGKSLAMLWEAFIHGLEYPGSNSLILRKTIPDLKRTVVDKLLAVIPREAYDTYNHTDHILYHHPDPKTGAQSKLYLSACERDADVGKFLSTEYVFIGFEELGEFSFAVWDALCGRNRCPIPGSRPCMVGVTNPMGIGWGWIKKLWVDKKPFIGMDPEMYNAADYEYFHSTVLDNPTYANNREYIQTLKASPKRGIIFEGRLDTVSGQYFENWDASRHIKFKEELIFQEWQPTWIGWDYGFGHYACITVFTKALYKDSARLNEHGQPTLRTVNVTIGELYLHKNTPKEQAEALIAMVGGLRAQKLAMNIEQIHFSWERFIKTQGDFTIADEVGDILAAAGLPRPTRSNTDRVAGWQKMYDLLDTDDWFITTDCPVLIESIPLLVRGDGTATSIEDVVKPKGMSLADDMGDSARYAIAGALLDEADVPESVKLRARLDAIKEPMSKFMAGYKVYNEQQRKERQGPKPPSLPTWAAKLRQPSK
jgi:hypothetical protein